MVFPHRIQWVMIAIALHGALLVLSEDQNMNMSQSDGHLETSFYSFPVMDISGNIVSLEEYSGKVSLVVNVASHCGYTDGHYKMLVLLQKLFEETNKFNVLAFPCNQFGGQEPGTPHEIADFVYNTMGANFPVFAKVDVLEDDANPAWRHLIKASGQAPTWNFWKYLVDHNGHVINAWGPSISPDQLFPNIQAAIDKATSDNTQQETGDVNKMDDSKRHKDEF